MKVFLMFCLDVVVVCRCVSSTNVFLLGFFLVQNVNVFFYENMYVFWFACEGSGMFLS
jgi:hypothetical protein